MEGLGAGGGCARTLSTDSRIVELSDLDKASHPLDVKATAIDSGRNS
jgi:hypothetical protein